MRSKQGLLWDTWNTEHIKKHTVTPEEVEEVYLSSAIQQVSYNNRIVILGSTANGRLLTIVCSHEKYHEAYVVSARDMSKKERRIYHEQTKTDQTI